MKTPLLLLCVLFSVKVYCQDVQTTEDQQKKPVHSIGFITGVNSFHFRDEYISPYIFSKMIFASGLSYHADTKRFNQSVDAFFSVGHPLSKIQPRDVTEQIGSLSYKIIHVFDEVHISGNPLDLSLGAGITSFISNTDFIGRDERYNYEWPEQSWYCSNSLNLILRSDYRLSSKKSLFAEFTIPIFQLVSRPENGHAFNDNNVKVIDRFINAELQGKPEFIWQNISIRCEAGYRQPLGKNCIFNLGYVFYYAHSERPLPYRMYMNQFLTGLDFMF
jgi:hypothetical protein